MVKYGECMIYSGDPHHEAPEGVWGVDPHTLNV